MTTTFSKKIQKQLKRRGWTRVHILKLIADPHRTVETKDRRHVSPGKQLDAPATAYVDAGGNYVVRNNETGDVVQVSNRHDPDWQAPFE